LHYALTAWGKILAGRAPSLSIEITRECPLRCPGCYAYDPHHLGAQSSLRDSVDYSGQALIDSVLGLIEERKPAAVAIVGGEPLVRHRELDVILPRLAEMGIHTRVVTSAVRPIPRDWAAIPNLDIAVSIDGLQPDHDERRKPATYDRILEHIAGHHVTIHYTVNRLAVRWEDYLTRFLDFWSDQPATKRVWFSLYTPQVGEQSAERLRAADREQIIAALARLRTSYPILDLPGPLLEMLRTPPTSPETCIFARVTACVTADLERSITPCQFGGRPECAECGCMATAGMAAIGNHRLPGGLRLGTVFDASLKVGTAVGRIRQVIHHA
jgi:MoaA/NifB/PqqE/SkfB family radical SAM enzyme